MTKELTSCDVQKKKKQKSLFFLRYKISNVYEFDNNAKVKIYNKLEFKLVKYALNFFLSKTILEMSK